MTPPRTPFTVHGGCNCKSVRYQVQVPEFSKRPLTPYRTPGADIGGLRLPMSTVCHCNDCRGATAAVLPLVFVTDIHTVSARALSKSKATQPTAGPLPTDSHDRYLPAEEIFDSEKSETADSETCLSFYASSPGRKRWFCSQCGTPIAYTIANDVVPKELGWPKMLDIWLGTVDRVDLERDWMAPERIMWCAKGVPWIRSFASSGLGGIPEHPLTKINQLVGDDIEDDLRALAARGK